MTVRTKIWVVSLVDAKERRAQIVQSLSTAPLDWSFFDAHTQLQNGLSYRATDSHSTHGRTLRAAELGCYSSHIAAWQWLQTSDYDQIFVFEDDVSADWRLIERLTTLDFAAMQIDYLRLFAKTPPRWRYVTSPFFDRYHHLIRCTSYALGAQAYVLTRAGAASLVQHGRRIRYPVDTFMDRYWEHGVPNLAFFPFPVFERSLPSSIGDARFAAERIALTMRSQYRIHRFADKLRMLREYIGPESASIKALKAQAHPCFLRSNDAAEANLACTGGVVKQARDRTVTDSLI